MSIHPLQRLDMYRLKARIGLTDHDFYESDKILKDLYKTTTHIHFLEESLFCNDIKASVH